MDQKEISKHLDNLRELMTSLVINHEGRAVRILIELQEILHERYLDSVEAEFPAA